MPDTVFPEGIQTRSYTPLRVQVYDALRDAIVNGRLKAGDRIIEDRVCSELRVSRSPLREALRRLEGEGLVTIMPRHGAVVTELTEQDGSDLFAVREVLEGLAARLAAEHVNGQELSELEDICLSMERAIRAGDTQAVVELNTRFHESVTRASRNRWIRELVTGIKAQIRRIYRSSIEVPDRASSSLAEHRAILDALRQKDAQRAERLAREHVLRAREAVPMSRTHINPGSDPAATQAPPALSFHPPGSTAEA